LILVLSWLVIVWECALPVVWVKPTWAPVYLLIGAFFHLGNFLIFGLNRFFFAWIAAYPALLFCIKQNLFFFTNR
jgi:hypothetical protein